MLAHLCKAKPLWTALQKTPKVRHGEVQFEQRPTNEVYCQLIHCAYCDNRECCSERDSTNVTNEERDSTQVTENPAYGLSEQWLETEDSQTVSEDVKTDQQTVSSDMMNNSHQATTKHTEPIPIKPDTTSKISFKEVLPDESSRCDIERDNKLRNPSPPKLNRTRHKSNPLDMTSFKPKQNPKDDGDKHKVLVTTNQNSSRLNGTRFYKKHQEKNSHSKSLKTSSTLGKNKLTDIARIKSEDNVQEWLMRISRWMDNKETIDISSTQNGDNGKEEVVVQESEEIPASTQNALLDATKESPANIPMVVMQCSRIHCHKTNDKLFQQTSLPMGTLVTALYKESDWLYVKTPHGNEGFVTISDCAPIGTVQVLNKSNRPWEPCDFPIQIDIRNPNFNHIQGAFVPVVLPTNRGKKPSPVLRMVKMKSSLYNDRHFTYTFKNKDSIKTAKTVTDILKSGNYNR